MNDTSGIASDGVNNDLVPIFLHAGTLTRTSARIWLESASSTGSNQVVRLFVVLYRND